MTGIDTSQGRLTFPPRFVPYLEKHRVFELFHELAELLVQEKPKDHVKFLKEVLPCAAQRRNNPRVVFLAPPSFDRMKFAEEVGRLLGIPTITRFYLEMKERERRMLEKLAREEARRRDLPSEEEMSCVCPGESEVVLPYQPPFLGEADGGLTDLVPETPVEESETSATETPEEEDPCGGLRVCPCKDEPGAEGKSAIDGAGSVATTKKGADSDADRIPATSKAGGSRSRKGAGGSADEDEEVDGEEPCVCESDESTVVDFGVLGKCEYSEKGWILADLPETAEEAEHMAEQGCVPTHAVRIVTDSDEERCRRYKYLFKDWGTVYKSIPVMDIHVNHRSLPQLAGDVCRLLRVMPHRHAPMVPRIILIGSRGSGATTQAKLLSAKYKMAHVEFEEEMARVVLQDDKLSETYKRQLLTRPDPELEAAILEKILLTPRCRKRGWVLTGYPTNIDQLRMVDLWATPPNRIIFLEVPAKECFVRLYYRKTDSTDGTEYKLPVMEPFGAEARDPRGGFDPEVRDRLLPHPRDDKRRIIHDIERFFEEKEEMTKYCGNTASHVNGNKSVGSVFELIDQIIIEPSPAEPPRDPLAASRGLEEAHERLRGIRMESGITANNLMLNPPNPIFKF